MIMTPTRTVAALGLVGLGALLFTFARTGAQSPAAPAAAADAARVIATIDGSPITDAEVEKALGPELGRLEREIYDLKRKQLDAMIAQRLLEREATKRNVAVEQLLASEVDAKLAPVADEEVDRFYETNKARIREMPDIKSRIREFLVTQQRDARREAFIGTLRSASKVDITLAAPAVRRANVSIEGAPVRGDASAAVTIVEFSDFHCPFCRTVQPTLLQLLERYKGKVKVVYRDLPLDGLHPNARRASEAARCAGEQGKFWEYHDVLYASGNDVSDAVLGGHAAKVGLDAAAFTTCLASGKFRGGIQNDIDEAGKLGVQSTPAFFVNGRLISGAQPAGSLRATHRRGTRLTVGAAPLCGPPASAPCAARLPSAPRRRRAPSRGAVGLLAAAGRQDRLHQFGRERVARPGVGDGVVAAPAAGLHRLQVGIEVGLAGAALAHVRLEDGSDVGPEPAVEIVVDELEQLAARHARASRNRGSRSVRNAARARWSLIFTAFSVRPSARAVSAVSSSSMSRISSTIRYDSGNSLMRART